ncbi:MAG: hypothetical protein I8H70_00165 [Burkholderiales bacterium]|nr:hypothetical protein [Burkholderiales bacterium]
MNRADFNHEGQALSPRNAFADAAARAGDDDGLVLDGVTHSLQPSGNFTMYIGGQSINPPTKRLRLSAQLGVKRVVIDKPGRRPGPARRRVGRGQAARQQGCHRMQAPGLGLIFVKQSFGAF